MKLKKLNDINEIKMLAKRKILKTTVKLRKSVNNININYESCVF